MHSATVETCWRRTCYADDLSPKLLWKYIFAPENGGRVWWLSCRMSRLRVKFEGMLLVGLFRIYLTISLNDSSCHNFRLLAFLHILICKKKLSPVIYALNWSRFFFNQSPQSRAVSSSSYAGCFVWYRGVSHPFRSSSWDSLPTVRGLNYRRVLHILIPPHYNG